MAEVKNYGLSGVHRTLQLGKQGPVLVGNADTDSFTVTLQDAATLTTMGGANASSPEHFITKAQLDVVYTEAQFLANVNYNSSSPILLGNITAGTKTIITTFEVDTAFDGNAVITVGTGDDNSLLMSDSYAEIEVTGSYQTTGLFEFASDTSLNIYVTQGGATTGTGKIIVSVVDGPVVNGGTINYGGAGSGIALTDLSVTTASPSGNGSLTYNNTTGVFTFTPAVAGSGSGAGDGTGYKGFKAHYGKMYDNNDDPNGPINKIVIYKDTASPTSTIDESTSQDTFNVTGLSGSDIVAILVSVHDNVTETPTQELVSFAESIIDNVILNNGVEGSFNTIGDMKDAFYDNFNTISGTLSSLKQELDFINYNNEFPLNPTFDTGKGAVFNSIQYNMNDDTLSLGSWGQGAGSHVDGDVFVIPGNTIQDENGNFLSTPANDITVTVTTSGGWIQTATLTGTLPRPTEVWPSNSINDGGDDEYDNGNYINTDLGSQISYNSGNVVTGASEFGGGDYVVTYRDGIFGMFAVGAAISQIGTSGNSGFDGDGVGVTGALIGTAAGVDIGDITFDGSSLLSPSTGSGVWPNGIISLKPGSAAGATYTDYGQFINVYPTNNYDQPHIHIDAGEGNNSKGDLILGSDNWHIDVNHNGSIYIKTSYQNYTWTFDDNGQLFTPGSIRMASDTSIVPDTNDNAGLKLYDTNNSNRAQLAAIGAVNIRVDSANAGKEWVFDTSGNITLPAGGDIVDSSGTSVLGAGGIALTNLSVTTNSPSGSGSLSYNNTSGVFSFTPADLNSVAGNYGDSNVVTLLSSFGSNTISTTGNITAGNINSAAGRSIFLGNTSSSLRQLGSNASVNLGGSVTLIPDTSASALNGVQIGGNGYLLGPNGSRNITLNYSANGGVGFQSNITVGTAGIGGTANIAGATTTGINSLFAGVTNTILSNTIAAFSASVNSYTQVTLQNKSTGSDATADFVITADNGSDTVNYADFGIINSGYDNTTPTNSLGNIVFAADTYLYAQGNASNIAQPGGNIAIGTTVTGKTVKIFAGGANSTAIVGTFSNTGLVVNGNVTAGNVVGTSTNVELVAGNYTYIFDNTGEVTLPTVGGDEGGQINLGIPQTNTTLQNKVNIDVYRNQLRIYEGSANARGVSLDLSKAPTGVGGELAWKVSALVDAGEFVTMDNLKVTVTTSGNRGLSVAGVSSSFTCHISGWYAYGGVSGNQAENITYTTTPSGSVFGWGFGAAGCTVQYHILDLTNSRFYRITLMIGSGYVDNFICIERLY